MRKGVSSLCLALLIVLSNAPVQASDDNHAPIPKKEPPLRGCISTDGRHDPIVHGPDLFLSDGSKSSAMSWQTLGDGTIVMQNVLRDANYEEHNQRAWQAMQEGCNMQRFAIMAKNRGDAAAQNDWHERSQAKLRHAKAELQQHLELIQSGKARLRVFQTFSNLATCCALLGETQEAIDNYNNYLSSREEYWTVPYGSFRLATVFMTEGKGKKELDVARRLLLSTVGNDNDCWTQANEDPEYRVLSWQLISEIERRQGDLKASDHSMQKAQRLLSAIANRPAQNGNQTSGQFIEQTRKEIEEYGIF